MISLWIIYCIQIWDYKETTKGKNTHQDFKIALRIQKIIYSHCTMRKNCFQEGCPICSLFCPLLGNSQEALQGQKNPP